MIWQTPRWSWLTRATTRASLLAAAENAIQSFQEADFGVPLMKKWHWLLHMPDFLQKHGNLPSTFTTERKHKTISAFATRLQKTHLMKQIVAMEVTTLREPGLFPDTCQLVEPKKPSKKQLQVLQNFVHAPGSDTMVASSARLARGGVIHSHDVVVFHHGDGSWQIGQVCFHLDLAGQKAALVQRWSPSEVHKMAHYAKCSINNEHGFVPIDSIQYPLLYSKDTEQEATVPPRTNYTAGFEKMCCSQARHFWPFQMLFLYLSRSFSLHKPYITLISQACPCMAMTHPAVYGYRT